MCECVYCLGDKPWSGEPNDWPHTPPVHVFLTLQEQDPNLWWRMSSGHGQNLTHWRGCDAVYPECVHPAVAILSDLIKELRAQHYADQCECGCEQWYECEPCSHISLCPTQEAAVRAEARLREVQGE